MADNITPRDVLKSYFEQCKKPTQEQFCELIDALFHKENDDLICNNLTIQGAQEFNAAGETATLSLGDDNHYIQSEHGKGVRIRTFGVNEGFFLEQGTGNVGIGTDNPSCKLDVQGDVCITGQLTVPSINVAGMGMIPTGGIIMWSGATPPSGWAICNGTGGTPDLRGRFIVGLTNTDSSNYGYSNGEKNRPDYNLSGKTGGAFEVKLTANQSGLRAHSHSHSLKTNKSGIHNHDIRLKDGGGGSAAARGGNVNNYSKLSDLAIENSGEHEHTVTGSISNNSSQVAIDFHDNVPPYYVLAFIIKL